MSESDVFKKRSKIPRSPPEESGFINDFSNLSVNLESIEKSISENRVENVVVKGDTQNRRSVSFTVPTTSSTFYVDDNSTNEHSDIFEKDSNLNDINNTFPTNFDHFYAAESTYSELQFPIGQGVLNQTVPLLSLKFLSEVVCVDNGIDHSVVDRQNCSLLRSLAIEHHISSTNNSRKHSDKQSSTANESINSNQYNSEEMALSVNTILSGIDKFSSKNQENVEEFISSVELYTALAGNNQEMVSTILMVVKSRLKSVTKLGNVQNLNLNQIKERLREKFKINITFDTAQEQLICIKQMANETIDSYGERVKKLLDIMNSYCTDEEEAVQNAQTIMNERLAIRKFKQNLYDTGARIVAIAANHTNLYDAISFVVEKFGEISSPNTSFPNNQPKENRVDKNVTKEKMYCHICKRKGSHFTRDCFSKNKNRDNQDSEKFQNQTEQSSNTKPFHRKNLEYRKSNRSINQAGATCTNNCTDQDESSNSDEDHEQHMQLQTFKAHLKTGHLN